MDIENLVGKRVRLTGYTGTPYQRELASFKLSEDKVYKIKECIENSVGTYVILENIEYTLFAIELFEIYRY